MTKPKAKHDPVTPEVLTVEQIATILDVSKMTVYRLIHDESLRAYRIRRQYRVRRDDLKTFMADADTWGDE